MSSSSNENTLTFVHIARIPPEGIVAYRAYKDRVLPLMAEHGGRLERRLRNEPGTLEVHIIGFASEATLQAYRNDPRRAAAAPLLERSAAKVELHSLHDVL